MLKTLLLSFILSITTGIYTATGEKFTQARCKALEALYEKYKDKLDSLSPYEKTLGAHYRDWYLKNCK